MFNQRASWILFLTTTLLLSTFSCRQKSSRPLPSDLNSYVYAFTSGVVSRTAPIRVRFASPVIDETRVGQEADAGILQFAPSISGQFTWEDPYTLRFQPADLLPTGTEYIATVQLKKVYPDVPAQTTSFDFEFRTREQFFEVKIDGLSAPDFSDLSRQQLEGRVLTYDAAETEKVEQLLSVRQKGAQPTISWNHSGDRLVHYFTVSGISRGSQDSQVEVSWNGKPLAVDLKGDRKVEVPALGNFKITQVEVIQEEDPYILLHFSDPLQEDQTLDGLVSIDGYEGTLRFLIDGGRLRLYASQRLVGTQRIRVNPGVRNLNGQRMTNPSEWSVQFTDVNPQVRLVGKGVILPSSEGLVFPFEAVSLKAVEVEVFKIYNNNILQFLQSNELDGSNELYRVGRIVLQRKVSLQQLNPGANTSQWTRYALDLSQMIEEDPEAIFQVRIGFRPEYSTYHCGGAADADPEPLAQLEPAFDNSGEINSIMDNWYGIDGYYDDFSWDQRDDPCYSAYYYSGRFVSRNVIASNLGIIAKGGKDNGYLLTLTDLRTAEPISGVNLDFYDFQQQRIGQGKTDSEGIALVKLPSQPFVVVARLGQSRGYLRLEEGEALSMSRFDVSGAVTQRGMKGFLYGDRGVWRPGDSVFLNFILEDENGALPAGYPVNFELYDPRGQLQERRSVAENVDNVYPLHFHTKRDAPTGNWLARVKAGGANFDKTLKIETVKPNRIEINLDFGTETLEASAEPITTTLQATWLHGAPAANLDAKVEVELRQRNTTFKDFPDYEFDDPARRMEGETRLLFDGPLDGNGKATFRAALLNNRQPPGRLSANFKTRVFEKGGDFSTDNLTMSYEPYAAYAGLALPANQFGEKRIEVDKPGDVALAVVNQEGRPLAGRRLNVGLYRVNWRWWWESGYDNVSRYNTSNHFDAQERIELVTNGQGKATWSITPNEWGRYLVRVCDAETGHCSGDYFYAGYPWYGEGEEDDQFRKAAAMLSFSADKETYAVGETATLTIPTGKSGRALITLENGTKVLESFWQPSVEGENTFRFKTTPAMAPNVYAHVTLLQPHGQVENDLPIRMYGVIPIKVEDPDTRLSPQLKMPDELRPEQTFTVEVSESKGKPMAYTLAIVDEGLLSLTRFQTPSPWDAFYAREALGVRTWDIYDQVLGAYGGELERILSIGGDGEIAPNAAKEEANRFEPVVRHLGPFWLEKNKKARHEITLPNYIGSVRAMLVAADQGAYGSADKKVPVRSPLMILATLPRVLGPGESLQLPVNVFAMDSKVRNVTLNIEESSGLVAVEGGSSRSIRFDKPGNGLVSFDLRVLERTGVARFRITANGNGESASQDVEIQVRNPNPIVTEVQAGVIEPSREWSAEYALLGMPGTNEGILEVSNIPPINLGERLNYLLRYPYGCLEQTLSGGFPQLFVSKLIELDEKQKEQVPKNIRATIDRLKQFQTNAGGFAYWPGQSNPDQWSTSYAGHFLLEAKALGYTIPPSMLQRWVDFQQKASRVWDPRLETYGFYSRDNYQLNQAYRLYTLALAKEPDLAAMNRLRESKDLGLTARWRLAAAYALTGKSEVAEQLTKGLATEVPEYQELAYTYGSGIRDEAMILETLVLLDKKSQSGQLVRDLSAQLSQSRWFSTQSISYSLLAIGKFVGDSDVSKTFNFTYQIGDQPAVNAGANTPIMNIRVPVDGKTGRRVLVRNPGQATLFARLILRGQPLNGDETVRSNNLQLAVTYRDMAGNTIDPARLSQGTDFIAEVQVSHPRTRSIPFEELALDQIFPSGWEIINTRMDNLQAFSAGSTADYRDFRDDRVYTFFDLRPGDSHLYRIQLNAAYLGRFYLPPVSCEAMYDHTISASRPGQWVEVVQPGAS